MANPRLQVSADIDFLVRAIAPLKNSGQDWSLKDIANEALIQWFNRPENIQLIKKHNLLEALKEKGLSIPEINIESPAESETSE